jgi:hypothetical protein
MKTYRHPMLLVAVAGFDPDSSSAGAIGGLSGMREWAILLRGRLKIGDCARRRYTFSAGDAYRRSRKISKPADSYEI